MQEGKNKNGLTTWRSSPRKGTSAQRRNRSGHCAFLSQEYLPFRICTVERGEGDVTFIFLLLLLHILASSHVSSEHGTTLQLLAGGFPTDTAGTTKMAETATQSLWEGTKAQREFVTGHILLSGHPLLLILEFIFSFIDLRYTDCSYAEKKKQIYTSVSQILGTDSFQRSSCGR